MVHGSLDSRILTVIEVVIAKEAVVEEAEFGWVLSLVHS